MSVESRLYEPAWKPTGPDNIPYQRRDLVDHDAELSKTLDLAITHRRDNPKSASAQWASGSDQDTINHIDSSAPNFLDPWSGITLLDLMRAGKIPWDAANGRVYGHVKREFWSVFKEKASGFEGIAEELAEIILLQQSMISTAILEFCYVREDEDGEAFLKEHVLKLFAEYLVNLHVDARILLDGILPQEIRTPHTEWLAKETAERQNSSNIGYLGKEGAILDLETLEVVEFESVQAMREKVRLSCMDNVNTPLEFVEKISEADYWAPIWAHKFPRDFRSGNLEVRVPKRDFIHDSEAMRIFKGKLRELRKPFIFAEDIDRH
ncbi:hypothetical protein BDZ45DRAFT_802302 [Acephala macrosclerotiorum]|nr:hypothetical protein BDZ45DRAFT_802302 [Acephala macrosclerotiorum]